MYKRTKEIGRQALDTTEHEIALIDATFYERVAIPAALVILGTTFSTSNLIVSKNIAKNIANMPIPTETRDFITNKNNVQPRNMAEQIPVLKDMPQGVKDFYQGSLGDYGQSAGSSSVMFQAPVPLPLKAVGALIPPVVGTWRDTKFTTPPTNKMYPTNTADFAKINTSDPIGNKNDVAAYWVGYATALASELALRGLGKARLDKKKGTEDER